ncbi:MAG: GNAT family N-acetyltransferase [Sciscionella sp.]
MTTVSHAARWPLWGLRISTPRLELRLGTEDDLDQLAELAHAGIHDPSVQPFTAAWTDQDPQQRADATRQWHWTQRGAWRPDRWTCELVVRHNDRVIGTQGLGARDFAILREVHTGSYLGRESQGHGFGTEMRAAVLHLAFIGLAAQYATTSAHQDNLASQGVSRKLGYDCDGVDRQVVRAAPITIYRYRLDRERWAEHRSTDVEITGLEPCLPWFGLPTGGTRTNTT